MTLRGAGALKRTRVCFAVVECLDRALAPLASQGVCGATPLCILFPFSANPLASHLPKVAQGHGQIRKIMRGLDLVHA